MRLRHGGEHVAVLERVGLVGRPGGPERSCAPRPAPARARRASTPSKRPGWSRRTHGRAARERFPTSNRRRTGTMTVTNVDKDLDACTLTIAAEFDAPLGTRVGDVGRPAQARALVGAADGSCDLRTPRARARRDRHLLHDQPGGRALLRRPGTSSRSDPRGRCTSRTPSQTPTATSIPTCLPGRCACTSPRRTGARAWSSSRSTPPRKKMQQLLDMGAAEGMQQAIGQMDALLAE